mgnify:CR=1 FL=1
MLPRKCRFLSFESYGEELFLTKSRWQSVQINNNEMLATGIGLRDSLQVRLKCKSWRWPHFLWNNSFIFFVSARIGQRFYASLFKIATTEQPEKIYVFLLQLFLNVRATSLSMHRIETWTSRDRRQNVTTISKQDGIVFKAKQEGNCQLFVHQLTDVTRIFRDGWTATIQMLKMALLRDKFAFMGITIVVTEPQQLMCVIVGHTLYTC